jgi:Domain of unknown function (DUF5020)
MGLKYREFRHNSVSIPPFRFPFPHLAPNISSMRHPLLFLFLLLVTATKAQNLQLHYDLRHTVDPAENPSNFPTLYFEYFKTRDSGHAFIKPGGFLLKTEADLLGTGHNIGKFFCQVTQSFRAWQPKILWQFGYSGGAGIANPKQYSYYIANTFQTGAEIPFHWQGAFLTSVLDYKYVAYDKPTSDPIYTLYWWRGLLHYKLELAGDVNFWTENRNHGDAATAGESGKRFFFFGEPQVWLNLSKSLAVGAKINLYYHINTIANIFQAYPTIALKVK